MRAYHYDVFRLGSRGRQVAFWSLVTAMFVGAVLYRLMHG